MRDVKTLSLALLGALAGCVIAPSSTELAPAPVAQVETVVAEARLAFVSITGTLPEEDNLLPPVLLDGMMDNVPVQLDLTLLPPLEPSIRQPDGYFSSIGDCGFGVVEAGEVSVPTGSNHMLLDVRMGSPESHPANLLTCEYDPAYMTEESPGQVVRLRGCFLPQSVSIPTAVQWVLSPLPASACGLGD